MGKVNLNLTKQEVIEKGKKIREKLKNLAGDVVEGLVTKDIAMIENAPGSTSGEMIEIAENKVRSYDKKANTIRSLEVGIIAGCAFLIGGGFIAPEVCPDSVAVEEISREVRKTGVSLLLPAVALSNITETSAKGKKQEQKQLIQAVKDNSGTYLPEDDFDMKHLLIRHAGRQEMKYILNG